MDLDSDRSQGVKGIVPEIKKRLKGRFGVILVFIAIAGFLWFLQALENSYVSVIENPVRFTRLPENKTLIRDLPKKISLEVKGTGFAVLRHNWDLSKTPIRIDFRELTTAEQRDQQNLLIWIPSQVYRQKIIDQIGNFEVLSIYPDTLIFEFSAVQSKKVPVKPNLGYELEKQYMLKVPVKVEPDSITITGPGKILDTINFIQTDLLKLKKVSGPVIRNLIIKKTSDQLRYSESRVVIRLEVEQYTEKTLKVPVIPVNVPDSLTMKVFPAQISLSFRVVVSEFDKITHDQFRIFADYRDLVPGKENLKVILSRFPLFIEQIRLQPETVEFILER